MIAVAPSTRRWWCATATSAFFYGWWMRLGIDYLEEQVPLLSSDLDYMGERLERRLLLSELLATAYLSLLTILVTSMLGVLSLLYLVLSVMVHAAWSWSVVSAAALCNFATLQLCNLVTL